MSDAEGRQFARVYFTRSAARHEVAESLADSVENPPESALDIQTPDPFQVRETPPSTSISFNGLLQKPQGDKGTGASKSGAGKS